MEGTHERVAGFLPLQEAWGTFILAFVIFGITNSGNKVLGAFVSEKFLRTQFFTRALWRLEQMFGIVKKAPKSWGDFHSGAWVVFFVMFSFEMAIRYHPNCWSTKM